MFERIILRKIPTIHESHPNQFVYKPRTSCEHAYFVANEAVNYYRAGSTSMHIVSLDASKAFDKLWRDGLFFKLKDSCSPMIWRILYCYYKNSKIIVSMDNQRGQVICTTEGVKQGGVLSPFLFNFFMNDLLNSCTNLKIGAFIGKNNVSILAYCDDILLLSPSAGHMEILLSKCAEYASNWKIEFNSKKSEAIVFDSVFEVEHHFKLNHLHIPNTKSLFYLGLPIGSQAFIDGFLSEKMSKVEKSMYSLRPLGCKPMHLSPLSLAFVYKQFCQSKLNYGFETINLSESKIKEFDMRQNTLVKSAVGISKFCHSKPLFDILKLSSIREIYMKHKVLFNYQLKQNTLTHSIDQYLVNYYAIGKPMRLSFYSQLDLVNRVINPNLAVRNKKEQLELIRGQFKCQNAGLLDSVQFIISSMNDQIDINSRAYLLKNLKDILRN